MYIDIERATDADRETEQGQGARFQTATPRPWKIHVFHTSTGVREALRCVGKSMTGRDWTAYVESEDGTSVLQTDGATEEEALANAAVVLEAVNALNPKN